MKIIAKPRTGGKTTEAIKESARTGAHIVAGYPNSVKMIKEYARELSLSIPEPISLRDMLSGEFKGADNYRSIETKGLIVDELDKFLDGIVPIKIHTATLTPDNLEDEYVRGIEDAEEALDDVLLMLMRGEKLIEDCSVQEFYQRVRNNLLDIKREEEAKSWNVYKD